MIREQKNIVHSLGICLKEHGIPLSINDVRSLAEGQLAAPDNLDPDAWIELIQPNLSEQMRKELKKFKFARCWLWRRINFRTNVQIRGQCNWN